MCKFGRCGPFVDEDCILKLLSPLGLYVQTYVEAPSTFAIASLSHPGSPTFGALSVSHLLMSYKSSSFEVVLFSPYQKRFRAETLVTVLVEPSLSLVL